MIVVDDLRPMLGCYGDSRIRTPHIDRLARRGVVFERAYCQYAKCGTSRLSLMTGLRPDSIGVFSNSERDVRAFRKRRPELRSMARWFKDAGYQTRSFGKIYHDGWDNADDWSSPSFPGRDGEMLEVVDESDPDGDTKIAERLACPVMQSPDVPDDHLFAGRMTTKVLAAMMDDEIGPPTFFAVGYRRPHLPFVAPRRYFDLYQPDRTWLASPSLPGANAPLMSWFNSDGYVGTAKRVGLAMPIRPTRQQAIDWNGYEMRSYLGVPNQGEIEESTQLELLRAYAACVSYVDAQIGTLLDALESSPRNENTVVILLSDHGWHLGEHSVWGKMTNYEIATRVPLIIAAPGIDPGRTDSPSELVDLYPTICGLARVDPPGHLEGESLAAVLSHPDRPTGDVARSQYMRFRDRYVGRAIRTSRYRYVAWYENEKVVERELYDHRNDPLEKINLAPAPTHAATVARLEESLEQSFRVGKP